MSIQNPVQMPVKVFSSEDTDAPQLTNQAGEIKTIYKGCLINGYGSTTPQPGWEMPFEDNDKAVFRSTNPQNPHYYRMDNNLGYGGTLGAYYSMTDVNTGDAWQVPDTWDARSGASFTPQGWRLLASETSVVFILMASNLACLTFFCSASTAVAADTNILMFKKIYPAYGISATGWQRTAECTFDSNSGGKTIAVASASAHHANVNNTEQFLMPGYVRYSNGNGQILGQLPFYIGEMDMPEQITDNINIAGRNFMQIRTSLSQKETIYIPTDYWLL